MKRVLKSFYLLIAISVTVLWGCKSNVDSEPPNDTLDGGKITYQNLVVGYSQLGAES